MSGRRAVFLDRDGTLNAERDYVYRVEDWQWLPGAVEAIRALNEDGFLVIVVSNQSGIARGLYSDEDVRRLHEHVNAELAKQGARVDAFYICPHHPDFGDRVACDCRKPQPGLLRRAAAEHGVDLTRSFMVGDKAIDVETAKAAGAAGLLVRTGYGESQRRHLAPEVPVAADLSDAVRLIRGAR